MTPSRKRSLEFAQFLLLEAADDASLPIGSRERLRMMGSRLTLEWEAIEGLASARQRPVPVVLERPAPVADDPVTTLVSCGVAEVAPGQPASIGASDRRRAASKSRRAAGVCIEGRANHSWQGGMKCVHCGAPRTNVPWYDAKP